MIMLMSAMSKLYAYLKKTVRKYSSPVFLLLVILSTVLWYVTKLSHTYTATIPVATTVSRSIVWSRGPDTGSLPTSISSIRS